MNATINKYLLRRQGATLQLEVEMPSKFNCSLFVAALVFSTAAAVSAGGWSVVTLVDFPDYAMVGKPLTLTFSVRQHGNTLVSGLKPTLQASTPGAPPIVTRATATARPGEYEATLEFDRLGDWSVVVDGGFNSGDKTRRYNSIVLPPLRVIRSESAPLVLFTEAERGATLLVTKGCVSCHVPGSDRDVTKRRLTAEHVRALLANPGARQIEMPNLGLRPAEISALAAYLAGSRLSARFSVVLITDN
jgi:hypothetical protein